MPNKAAVFVVAFTGLMSTVDTCHAVADCFTRSRVPKHFVIEQAPPPLEENRDYHFYPVSLAVTARVDRLIDNKSHIPAAYLLWSNHGPRYADRGYKGNITSGSPGVQIRFSSRTLADRCTLAQTAQVVGVATPSPLGLKMTTEAQTADTRDVCVLPAGKLPPSTILFLDYEVQDDRSEQESLSFLTEWIQLVHAAGHQGYLYPNALDAPSQKRTNLSPIVRGISTLFDKIHILLWSRNSQHDLQKSYLIQKSMLGLPPPKVLIAFELIDTTMDDARFVNGLLRNGEVSGVNIWRNHAQVGGPCESFVNRKLACIAFDEC